MGNETILFVGAHYEITNPGSGQVVTKYYFAGTQRVAMRKYTIPQNMTVEYLLGDHLGSTSITTDSAGTKTSEIRYKPWGEIRSSWTLAQSTTPAYKLSNYTFTGQFSYMDDPSTTGVTEGFGLMFYNARMYDPALGRFTSPDSIIPGGAQGLDRYAYVNNSPVNFTDPTGHITCPVMPTQSYKNSDCIDTTPAPSDPPPADGDPGSDKEAGDIDLDGSLQQLTDDYEGGCYMDIGNGTFSSYIQCNYSGDNYLISDPQSFSEYLMIDHVDLTELIATQLAGGPFGGLIDSWATSTFVSGVTEYTGQAFIPNTLQEIGRYIGRASNQNGGSAVSVTLIKDTYYRKGPYTNMNNKALYYENISSAVLIQAAGSNSVQSIIIQDLYIPELTHVLKNTP